MSLKLEVALRALEPEDIDLLYKWENDMEIWEVSNTLTPFSKHQLKKYIELAQLDIYQTKQLRLIVEGTNAVGECATIGLIDLFEFDPYHSHAGVGVMINEAYRNQGYALEALNLLVDYSFSQLGLHQVYANISITNTASIQLFKNAGFVLSGEKKQWKKTKDGFVDELFFQKINPKHF